MPNDDTRRWRVADGKSAARVCSGGLRGGVDACDGGRGGCGRKMVGMRGVEGRQTLGGHCINGYRYRRRN